MANNLERYLDKPVAELAKGFSPDLPPEEQERHRIYANLLLGIAARFFNGRKYGSSWEYPLAPDIETNWSTGTYLGHNIAALAVDRHGHVVDFAFNHNEFYQSSVEHAEARLLRRVFSLAEVYDSWALHESAGASRNYANLLSDVTIYTSLESCTQCSGIMTLAGVKAVVYLQDDPQMYHIGNIVRRLSEVEPGDPPYLQAPLPIPGSQIGLDGYSVLNERFAEFKVRQAAKVSPFRIHRKTGEKRYSPTSITSFLCTKEAFEVFTAGGPTLDSMAQPNGLAFGAYRPDGNEKTLRNAECLDEVRSFLKYVESRKDRASAHKG